VTSVRDETSSAPSHTAGPRSLSEVDARFAVARAAGRKTRAEAARAAARPCPGCGCVPPQTPGKKARIFCNDGCRKRASRAAKRPAQGPADLDGGPRSKSGQLGTESTEFRTPSNGRSTDAGTGRAREGSPLSQEGSAELKRVAAAKARKSQRYAGRRTLWKITTDRACKGCGRNALDPDTGVIIVQTADGDPVVLGTQKCARIWLCPVCSAKIRMKRAAEITRAVVAWIQAGGTCYLVSLTARHDYQDRLADLMDAIQGTRAGTPEEIAAARQAKDAAKDTYAARCRLARKEARATVDEARLAAPKGKKREAMADAREAAALVLADNLAMAKLSRDDELARLRLIGARQAGAFQRLITGGTWAGDKREKASEAAAEGIRDRIGYIGMIRATEVTVGTTNLWHPHIHAIVFVGGRTTGEGSAKRVTKCFTPGPDALQEWEDHWRATWTNHLARVNPKYRPSDECGIPDCKCDGKGHGVDFVPLETARDAQKLGEYIAKTQDGKSPALELAGAHLKTGREGNMTPFEVLFRLGDLLGGVLPEDAPGHGSRDWCIGIWHEYENAVTGRRAIEWTRHLRPLLGIKGEDTEEGDLDLLLGVDGETEFRGGAAVTDKGWTALNRKGLDLAVEDAAEGKDVTTDPAAVAERIKPLLEAAGVEVTAVRPLTTGEVSDAYAAILARTQERREAARDRRKRAADVERDRVRVPKQADT
jgi:hypothetical protein